MKHHTATEATQQPRCNATRAAGLFLLLLALSILLPASAQNLGFEEGGASWQVAVGEVDFGRAAALVGQGGVSLSSSPTSPAWCVSDPLNEFVPGKVFEVSIAAKRQSGECELALALVSEAAQPAEPFLWRGVPGSPGGWHRLALRLVVGLSRPRIALGAVGAPGVWLVDDIRIRPVQLAPVTKPVRAALQPTYSEPLPHGWRPDGDMDLLTRTIMGADSYYIRSGSFELNPQREITVRRGERTGMGMDLLSRGDTTRSLRIEAMGPEGWRAEPWEQSIAGRGSKAIALPLQAMLAGDHRLKLLFSSGSDTREMPLLVHSHRYYPALGAFWDGAPATQVDLGPMNDMPIQIHHLRMSGTRCPKFAASLAETGADIALTWGTPAAQALEGLVGLPADLRTSASAFGLAGPELTPDHVREFIAAVRAFGEEAVVFSRPFDLSATVDGLTGGEDLTGALEAGGLESVDVLAVRTPPLSGSTVLREFIDGRAELGPMQAWSYFDRAWDLMGLRQQLRTGGASLPFYAQAVGGRSTGDPQLDAILTARVLIHIFAMGANAATLPAIASDLGSVALIEPSGAPNKPLQQVYSELARELAGVRSLGPPASSDLADYYPGKPVTFRHFMRGDEGIIALWNNSQRPQEIGVDMRARPTQTRLLRLSYPGEMIQREFDGDFTWSPTARQWNHPAVYLTLEPLELVVLSMKLRDPHAQWLREVGPQPPKTEPKSKMDLKKFLDSLGGDR